MSFWIAHALEQERERLGLSRSDVATPLGVDQITIKRLESGMSQGRDIDRYVAGYAYLLGMEDGRELWHRALKEWQAHGSPPVFRPAEGPAAAFAEAIRVAALRHQQDTASQSETRSATRRKRAGG